ncbi:hypothetical protein E2C01_037653 [Portunus trituberculatus]|uniref:Uncharacterized protein n=1 Tax=Portunus trituberculatus TaxID=210409 RepID=A0A5B7FEL8_PORTR|nr:hypothetical protein [Portunus trituberculatus]
MFRLCTKTEARVTFSIIYSWCFCIYLSFITGRYITAECRECRLTSLHHALLSWFANTRARAAGGHAWVHRRKRVIKITLAHPGPAKDTTSAYSSCRLLCTAPPLNVTTCLDVDGTERRLI